MISVVRKNLASLIYSHNSFVCKSPVSLALSLHFFSTSSKIYDLLLHKHHLSHKLASLVASESAKLKSPENADLMLSFLKQSGCSIAQLEKIVKYRPSWILSASVEDIKFKIKIFQDVGLSSEDVAKMISINQVILQLSAKNNIIPSLALLKGLLGSDYDVARVLRRSGRVLTTDLERRLMPNIEFLKSCGIPMERVLWLLYNYPWSLLIKPDVMKQSVNRAIEMGLNPSSDMFVHAVRCIAPMRKGLWEVKWQAFRNLGFLDREISTMFKMVPTMFNISTEKIEKIKELLFATGNFNLSSIVHCPTSLKYSVEKRYKPRLRVVAILESRKLVSKWPSLATICTATDDRFFKSYISPYLHELGEEYARESHVKGKGR